MDPSLRSSLFNRMMQAMELGDKCTADKIESLIRNFCPDSSVPISVYVPSSEDNFIPNISPPSSNSDSPVMPKSSTPGGSKRRVSRAPRESLLDAQTTVDSDVEDHQRDRLHFSLDRPCSFDTEVNVVGEEELRKYKSRFDIPDSVTLMLPGDRAMWNPPENAVAIYGAMLSCGVTLPLQPFIARFLTEARIAPAQHAPNSYRILMCLCLMWKLKGYGPPTPREIHHFYTLRQAGNGGMYFLLSSPVENWILEGVANPSQVEISSDEKKKGFIWGFPTSNKRWKNSWFFTGGEWGRDVPASSRRNLSAKKVPRHFTSPEVWSKAVPVLLDREISHLIAAAVLHLDSRDRSFLLDEEKMIFQQIFTRLLARLPRLCDFDTVCDLQARAVKNSEAASKRHAIGLAKEGIASLDGDDPSDDEEAGDVFGGGAESGRPPIRAEVAANTPVATTPAAATPSRKGKEKVGASGRVSDIPNFNADVPETPHDPASDLAPRAGRGASEPALAKTPSIQTDVREDPAEGTNVAVPPPEEVNELNIPVATPPRTASPPMATGESNVSSDQPRPSGRPESVDRPGPSKQTGTSASGSGFAHEAPPAGPTGADEGNVSLSDFSATEICSHLVNNDVYIGESWGHVKGKSCNRKMEFFFNRHSLLAQLRESSDGHLSAQLATEEKLSATEEEIRSLKEHLSASQESFAARLEAEEAREKAEHEALDLRNQLSSRELIFDNLKAVLEVEAVDRFKRSPAYDVLLLCEFERGMRQSKKFFAMKDHSNEKALRRFDRSLQQHMASGVGLIKEQIKRWKAHCHYNRTEPHRMHLEIPSKRAFNTYYSGQKGSFSGSSAKPDLGPVAERDYEPFMPNGDEEVTRPSEEEIEDEEDSEGPPAAS
ncbi:hypothetical protein LWI29_034048 [Acer saccharum]|uniref:Uncharacterized protein n=1 Tax=Acer saccharum TaxID=4024 RepID=A0AA39W9H4_ACESA|nr:hypothetical protein LWI29_034048 [Acer saccharum]